MTLGTKLQSLRKSKNMSQEDLANLLNVSRQAISKWETDQSLPDITNIIAISNLFGVSTDYLLLDQAFSSTQAKSTPDKTKTYLIIIIGICSSIIGFIGNFTLYIISRFIKAPIWITIQNGNSSYRQPFYTYNFSAFISAHHLWVLVIFFLVIMLTGITILVYHYRSKIKAIFIKLKEHFKLKKS